MLCLTGSKLSVPGHHDSVMYASCHLEEPYCLVFDTVRFKLDVQLSVICLGSTDEYVERTKDQLHNNSGRYFWLQLMTDGVKECFALLRR